jgi:hypothetical protein
VARNLRALDASNARKTSSQTCVIDQGSFSVTQVQLVQAGKHTSSNACILHSSLYFARLEANSFEVLAIATKPSILPTRFILYELAYVFRDMRGGAR